MQIGISLIPALGLNGVALVAVCSLVKITCEEDDVVAKETYSYAYKNLNRKGHCHRNTFYNIITAVHVGGQRTKLKDGNNVGWYFTVLSATVICSDQVKKVMLHMIDSLSVIQNF